MPIFKKSKCNMIGQFATEDYSLPSVTIFTDIQLYVVYLSEANKKVKERVWKKINEFRKKKFHMMIIRDYNLDAREFDVLTKHLIENDMVQLVKELTHIDGRVIDHLWA